MKIKAQLSNDRKNTTQKIIEGLEEYGLDFWDNKYGNQYYMETSS